MMNEYKYLQAVIDKIDGQRFQIRNWAIIAAGALFTASLSAKIPLIAIGGVITTLFFAFLETIYMQMMSGVMERSKHLESLIENYRAKGEEPAEYIFGVGQAFSGSFSFKKIRPTIISRNRIHVTAFYTGLIVVTAAGGVAAKFL
jgi:hypothetical protein